MVDSLIGLNRVQTFQLFLKQKTGLSRSHDQKQRIEETHATREIERIFQPIWVI